VIDLQSIITVSTQQISCDLGDEAVVLNLSTGEYFGLDPVGARIWSWLTGPQTVAGLRDRLVEAYDADSRQIEQDLVALLEQLKGEGLIEVSTGAEQRA
jgi:hypothetical protein